MSADDPGPREWITAVLIWVGLAIAVMAYGLWKGACVTAALAEVELHLQRQDEIAATILANEQLLLERSATKIEGWKPPEKAK